MGFNSGFKGLKIHVTHIPALKVTFLQTVIQKFPIEYVYKSLQPLFIS